MNSNCLAPGKGLSCIYKLKVYTHIRFITSCDMLKYLRLCKIVRADLNLNVITSRVESSRVSYSSGMHAYEFTSGFIRITYELDQILT